MGVLETHAMGRKKIGRTIEMNQQDRRDVGETADLILKKVCSRLLVWCVSVSRCCGLRRNG